jgi:parallel beta-helix repeat protein
MVFKDWGKKDKIKLFSGVFLLLTLIVSCSVYALTPAQSVTGSNLVVLGSGGKLQNYDGSGVVINNLSDVQVIGLLDGQVLVYNSSSGLWTNRNQTATVSSSNSYSFSNLTDCAFVALANGDIPIYNSSSGKWVNQSPFSSSWNATVNALITSATISTSQISGLTGVLNAAISSYLASNPIAYGSLTGAPSGVQDYSYLIGVFSNGTYYVVNGSTNQYVISWSSTNATLVINNAIALGGNVFISSGTYYLTGFINASVNNLDLYGAGQGVTVLNMATGTYKNNIQALSVSGVLIHDLTVDGNNANNPRQSTAPPGPGGPGMSWAELLQNGISLQNCSGCQIYRCTALNNAFNGIQLYATTNSTVNNCVIVNSFWHGLELWASCAYDYCTYNYVAASNASEIVFENCYNCYATYNTITGINSSYGGARGFEFHNGGATGLYGNNIVSYNTIIGGCIYASFQGAGSIISYNTLSGLTNLIGTLNVGEIFVGNDASNLGMIISYNSISNDVGFSGIYLSQTATVIGNNITSVGNSSSGQGIYLATSSCSNSVIKDNSLYNIARSGIYVSAGNNNTQISGNFISYFNTAQSTWDAITLAGSSGSAITNTSIVNNFISYGQGLSSHSWGIGLSTYTNSTFISNNMVTMTKYGVVIADSSSGGTIVVNNDLTLYSDSGTSTIYHNNMVNGAWVA